jgi:hypothetical protein
MASRAMDIWCWLCGGYRLARKVDTDANPPPQGGFRAPSTASRGRVGKRALSPDTQYIHQYWQLRLTVAVTREYIHAAVAVHREWPGASFTLQNLSIGGYKANRASNHFATLEEQIRTVISHLD